MEDNKKQVVQEFEEKILSIVSDNLEVVTNQLFEMTVEDADDSNEEMLAEVPEKYVLVNVEFAKPEFDYWRFILPTDLAAIMASSMGGEEPVTEYNEEEYQEPLNELINQMLSSYLSELSSLKGESVETINTDIKRTDAELNIDDETAVTRIKVVVNQNEEYFYYKLTPTHFPEFLLSMSDDEHAEVNETVSEPIAEQVASEDGEKVQVNNAQFQTFADEASPKSNGANLDMLMDLEMAITIELGRTKLSVREVLDLGQGSIIELDKLSGDPVDVFINDRRFARGEVVVVDENFGVRITEILSPSEKLQSLQ